MMSRNVPSLSWWMDMFLSTIQNSSDCVLSRKFIDYFMKNMKVNNKYILIHYIMKCGRPYGPPRISSFLVHYTYMIIHTMDE